MRRSVSEIIRSLEIRIARLERRTAGIEKKELIPKELLETVIEDINEDYGFDENDEEVDLELSIRDWKYEEDRTTKDGRQIIILSIRSDYNRETFYVIFVQADSGRWREWGIFEGESTYKLNRDITFKSLDSGGRIAHLERRAHPLDGI